MRKNWEQLKGLIKGQENQDALFLSIINEEGIILKANARMVQSFHLNELHQQQADFNELIHPVNIESFRNVLSQCRMNGRPGTTELYLKNGQYQHMKWEIIPFDDERSGTNYLCAGVHLAEKERLEKFANMDSRHYQHIIEGLNDGILLHDTNGDIISANPLAASILGMSVQDLYAIRNIRHIWNKSLQVSGLNGEKLQFEQAPFVMAIQSERFFEATLAITSFNGETRHLQWKSQPLMDEEGKNVCAVITRITDITMEQKLSSQLAQKEKLFYDFIHKSPNLAWVIDEDARLVVASKAFFSHFNIDEKYAEGRDIRDLVPASVFNTLFEKHLRVLENGTPESLVEKANWVDGTHFVFHISIFPFEAANGKRLLGGQAVNVAEKYAVEKQLRETNERLLLMTRASSNAIWEWDMQTGYIFRNDALMDMIGYPQEATKGLSWWLRRIHPEDRNRVEDRVKEVTDAGGQSWEQEYRFKCADGQYKNMLDKGFVVYENALPVRMIGSLQDVTDVKKLENALLEEKISHQKEVSETAIRVQEKERTRIGHELHDNVNQILSTAKLFVDLLSTGSEEQRGIKEKSISYLMMAIDEIRKLSRELVTPQLQENGLISSIDKLIADLRISTRMDIKVVHDNEASLLIYGKQITLFRIIQEQLKNIVTHSGARQVNIHLQRKEDEMVLLIRDDGKGFNVRKSSNGIGLSNIYKRAKYYGGHVNLISAPGEGCTLEVRLPFTYGEADTAVEG